MMLVKSLDLVGGIHLQIADLELGAHVGATASMSALFVTPATSSLAFYPFLATLRITLQFLREQLHPRQLPFNWPKRSDLSSLNLPQKAPNVYVSYYSCEHVVIHVAPTTKFA